MMPHINAQHSKLNVHRSACSAHFRTSCRAFTLIETALAILAIGLGLIAIFGLGRIGLQTSKETENDMRCAQMADAVFATLREYNARFVDIARTNAIPTSWLLQWQTTVTTPEQIPFPLVANMSVSANLFLSFWTEPPPPETITTAAAYDPDTLSLSDWNPRYNLFLDIKYKSSDVAGGPNFVAVTLFIYPDGDTYSSDPRIFHTTLTNPGGLP